MSVCSSTHVHLLPSSQVAGWVLEWSDSGHVSLEAHVGTELWSAWVLG